MGSLRGLLEEDRKPKRLKVREQRRFDRKSGHKGTQSREVMFKVRHWHKSARAARQTAAYNGRFRKEDPVGEWVDSYDTIGTPLMPSEVREHLAKWGLKEDHENLSDKAEEVRPSERHKMPENERLKNRQSAHLIISFPKDAKMSMSMAKDIVQEVLKKNFADQGHEYIFNIHNDKDNIHAHVLLKAKSSRTHKMVRIDAERMLEIRKDIAKVANERFGLGFKATAREDRVQVREAAKGGQETARVKDDYRKATGKEPRRSWLQDKAPGWYSRHGAEYERRRADLDDRHKAPTPEEVPLPKLSSKTNQALKKHFKQYERPEEARQQFLEMVAEAREYAYWAANNRPETFGQAKPGAEFKDALTQATAPISNQWRDQARQRIQATVDKEPRERYEARTVAAQQIRNQAEDKRKRERAEHTRRVMERARKRYGLGAEEKPDRAKPEAKPQQQQEQKPAWFDRVRNLFKQSKPIDQDQAEVSKTPSVDPPQRQAVDPSKVDQIKRKLDLRQRGPLDRGPDKGGGRERGR